MDRLSLVYRQEQPPWAQSSLVTGEAIQQAKQDAGPMT
jgi:hypothetical protein